MWFVDFSDVVNYFPVYLNVDIVIFEIPYVLLKFRAVFFIRFKTTDVIRQSFFECAAS